MNVLDVPSALQAVGRNAAARASAGREVSVPQSINQGLEVRALLHESLDLLGFVATPHGLMLQKPKLKSIMDLGRLIRCFTWRPIDAPQVQAQLNRDDPTTDRDPIAWLTR